MQRSQYCQSISGNLTERPDSVICEGSLFNTLGCIRANGGGWYKHIIIFGRRALIIWVWTDAYSINNLENYTPDTSRFSIEEHIYYRRRVTSGAYDVCVGLWGSYHDDKGIIK